MTKDLDYSDVLADAERMRQEQEEAEGPYVVQAYPVSPASGYGGPQGYNFGPYNLAEAVAVGEKLAAAGYDCEIEWLIKDPSDVVTNYES